MEGWNVLISRSYWAPLHSPTPKYNFMKTNPQAKNAFVHLVVGLGGRSVPFLMWCRYKLGFRWGYTAGHVILIDKTIKISSGALVLIIEDSRFKVPHPVRLLHTKNNNSSSKVNAVHLLTWSSETAFCFLAQLVLWRRETNHILFDGHWACPKFSGANQACVSWPSVSPLALNMRKHGRSLPMFVTIKTKVGHVFRPGNETEAF